MHLHAGAQPWGGHTIHNLNLLVRHWRVQQALGLLASSSSLRGLNLLASSRGAASKMKSLGIFQQFVSSSWSAVLEVRNCPTVWASNDFFLLLNHILERYPIYDCRAIKFMTCRTHLLIGQDWIQMFWRDWRRLQFDCRDCDSIAADCNTIAGDCAIPASFWASSKTSCDCIFFSRLPRLDEDCLGLGKDWLRLQSELNQEPIAVYVNTL